MIHACARCRCSIFHPAGSMRISGGPLGLDGPRLIPTTLCPDCCSQLARWLATPPSGLGLDDAKPAPALLTDASTAR